MKKRYHVPFIVLLVFAGLFFCNNVFSEEITTRDPKIKKLVTQLYDQKAAFDAEARLAASGKKAVEYLLPLLQDKTHETVRASALRVLAKIGDASVEEQVVAVLNDPDNLVRQEAAKVLSIVAEKESTIAPLKALLSDYYAEVRYNAIKALAKLARENEIDVFLTSLSDPDPRVRKFALNAIGKLRSAKALPVVVQMVNDPHPDVRLELVNTLGLIGTEECLSALVALMRDPEPKVRVSSIDKISELNVAGKEEALIGAASNVDPLIVERAVIKLAEIKSPKALQIAKDHLGDEYMNVKLAAIEAIGKVGSKGDKEILRPLLAAESTLVRKKAKEILDKSE